VGIIDWDTFEAELSQRMGRTADLGQEGRLGEALDVLDSAYQMLEGTDDATRIGTRKQKLAPVYHRLSLQLLEAGDAARALRAMERVVEAERPAGDLPSLAAALSDLARTLYTVGRPTEALELLRREVLPLRERLEDLNGIAGVYRHLSIAHFLLRQPAEAFEAAITCARRAAATGATGGVRGALELAIWLLDRAIEPTAEQRAALSGMAQQLGAWDMESRFQPPIGELPAQAGETFPVRRVRVFISYTRDDQREAQELYDRLNGPHLDVFYDRAWLDAGREWEPDLVAAAQRADVLVLLVGRRTLDRPYVRKELASFFEGAATPRTEPRRAVIPILLPGAPDIPEDLKGFQALDFRHSALATVYTPLLRAIHGAYYLGEHHTATARRGPSNKNPDPTSGAEMQRLADAGEIGMSPTLLVAMVNMGVIKPLTQCVRKEWDPTLPNETRDCESGATVLCIGCAAGTCGNPDHVDERFTTVLGTEENPWVVRERLFYWCNHCRAPACLACLDLFDDYPVPISKVRLHRFYCPACRGILQIVSTPSNDAAQASGAVARWARAQGPAAE